MQASAASFARKGGGKVKGKLKVFIEQHPLASKYEAIRGHVQRPGKVGEDFVTVASLREVWKWAALRKFIKGMVPGFEASDEQLDFIEKNLLKTFSILVYMRWEREEWQRFPEIFMKEGGGFREDRLDAMLPYELEAIEEEDFLGSWGLEFYRHQYIFIPIVLRQGEVARHERGRRLPLKTGGKELGSGAYGKVIRETIPEGHLVLKGEGEVTNTKDRKVARKVILGKLDFKVEIQNLKQLREGLREHKRIVTNIAAAVIGNEFNIFFDLAKTDLSTFLYDIKHPPDPKTLIEEARNLVDALHFLHNDLSSEKGDDGAVQKVCYHADLKPENILVYERPEDPSNDVGRWKIADFGISKIETLPEGESTTPGANITMVVEQRVRGIYTAPETDAGRLSDIWSFGCIFHQILAAGLGGGSLIKKLDDERCKIVDSGSSIRSPSFYKVGKEGIVLKSCTKLWVENELPKHPRSLKTDATQECSKLTMEMLQIDKSKRPDARRVKTWLGHIIAGHPMPARKPPAAGETAVSDPAGKPATSGPAQETAVPEPPRGSPVLRPVSSQPVEKPAIGDSVGRPAPTPPPPLSLDLISAIESTNPTTVYDLIKKGDKILARDRDGQCALHHAAKAGGKRVLVQLLKSNELKGGEINQRDNSGATPLHRAASGTKWEIASELIKAGADLNAKDNDKSTPLHYAALGARRETGSELIKAGADKNAKDCDGRTPLHIASLHPSRKHVDFVEFLLDSGAAETPNLPPEFKEKKNLIQYRKRKQARGIPGK